MVTVRFATLADVEAISAIHRSDITEWRLGFFDSEGLRQHVPATWQEASLIDRWEMGGAWMSPELCAIHINRMLLGNQIVLVAEEDECVVGELEIFVGEDHLYGFNANLSVFYTQRERRGRGIGTCLLQDALELVREIGCDTLTTYNPEIPDYYARFGLERERVLQQVVAPTTEGLSPLTARRRELPSFSRLSKLNLLCGRILSSRQLHWQLAEEAEPGGYAIAAAWRPAEFNFVLGSGAERSYLVLRDRSGRGAWATVHLWGPRWSSELLQTILVLGNRLGFEALHFIVEPSEISVFDAVHHDPPQDATVIHCLRV